MTTRQQLLIEIETAKMRYAWAKAEGKRGEPSIALMKYLQESGEELCKLELLVANRERGDHSSGADRQRAGRDTLGSRAHSESRASSLDRRRFPRVGLIEPQDLAKFGFQDSHAAGDSGTRLARLSDTGPVGVPIAVAVFHPSSLPVIMAYRESRHYSGTSGNALLIQRQKRLLSASELGACSRLAISSQ